VISVHGSVVISNRNCLRELAQAMLHSRIQKASGRCEILSEAHNTICSLLRSLCVDCFYVTTSFADNAQLVAVVLAAQKNVKECLCVNIDSPEIPEAIDIEVRLFA